MSGLNNMAKQSANKRIATAASFLQSKLESGKSISDSMLEYPELFPPFYTSMVRAGEVSGNLEQVLNDYNDLPRMADKAEKRYQGSACISGNCINRCCSVS